MLVTNTTTGAVRPALERPSQAEFSLALGETHLQIQKWARDFAEGVIRPSGPLWDEREETPWPVIRQAAQIGLHSPDFVRAAVADPTGLTYPLVAEAVAWGDPGIALAVLSTGMACKAILANGTAAQCEEWFPQCFGTAEAPALAAGCISEAEAGSDIGAIRTSAVYDAARDEWILNGVKNWVTNGGIAGVHIVIASVARELGARGHCAFVVPPGTRGLRQGQKYKKMGVRASHTAEVILDDCRVPGRCLLGDKEIIDERMARTREGRSSGGQPALATLQTTRPLIGAQAVGVASAAYEYALAYATERHQFGRPIVANQGIAFRMADMRIAVDAARLLVWRASWEAANGLPDAGAAGSMAKVFAGETAVWVTEAAIQTLGGYGYVRDHPVERWHRDSKIYTIFEGTSEIQRLVISRAISGVNIR